MATQRGALDVQTELAAGFRARAGGFEGRARVCARRAAGAAARDYLRARRVDAPNAALDCLWEALQRPELDAATRVAGEALLLRVDEGFHLPQGVDLLREAQAFIAGMERLAQLYGSKG